MIARLVLLALFLFSSGASALGSMDHICDGQPVPSGYVVIDRTWDPTSCGNPIMITPNVDVIWRYSDSPVGAQANACLPLTAPPGWVIDSTQNGYVCGYQYGVNTGPYVTIRHTSCVNQSSTTCYPPSDTPPPPQITVSSQNVVVPYQHASANVTLSWTAVSTASNWRTDIAYRKDGGNLIVWKDDVGAGSANFAVSPNSTYTFYAFQHHYSTSNSTSVVVHTTAGAAPSMHASPATVTVPWGMASSATTVTWNAPGYGTLDWCGSTNGGAWAFSGLQTLESGNVGVPMTPGTTYAYRLYPHGQAGTCTTTNLLTSLTVSAVSGPQPTMSASPSSVVVPYGAANASTTVSWNAPGYSSVDWCGKVGTGAWQFAGLVTAGSGSVGVPMPPNTTYGYRLYAHGAATNCPSTGILTSLSVTSTQGAQPTFRITPSHVVVPLGQTTGSFTLSWNAPGYATLDLWGKVNNGPWQFGLEILGSSSVGSPLDVGTTYSYRFYPHGNSTQLLGEISVSASH